MVKYHMPLKKLTFFCYLKMFLITFQIDSILLNFQIEIFIIIIRTTEVRSILFFAELVQIASHKNKFFNY